MEHPCKLTTTIGYVLKECPQLENLYLWNYMLNSDDVNQIAKGFCSNLKHIQLRVLPSLHSNANNDTLVAFDKLSQNCTNLTSLDINACDSEAKYLRKFLNANTTLQSLSLRCWRCFDHTFDETNPLQLPHLCKLSVFNCSVRTPNILLSAVSGISYRLTELCFDNCKSSDAILSELEVYVVNLTSLCLNFVRNVTETVLVRFISRCPKLKRLEAANKACISDAWLGEVAIHCPLLESLTLRSLSNITDAGILQFTQSCEHLKVLTVRNCAKVKGDMPQDVASNT